MRLRYDAIRRGRAAFCQMAVLLLTPFASATRTGKAPAVPATLRSIGEVFRLDKDHARNGYPVRLQAVVTYSDMEWGLLFVQDESGAVYINVHGMAESFPVGARVQVDAVTGAGEVSPVLLHPKIKVLGRGQVPQSAKWTLAQLDALAADSQWVETRGVLRPTNQAWDRISFRLVDGPVEAVVVIPQPNNAGAQRLIGSTARVRAVCGSVIDSNGKRIGTQLFVPSMKDIEIEERALPDPFATSPRPIGTLSNSDAEPRLVHWLHVRGEVTWESAGTFFVEDMSGAICVQENKKFVVHTGEVLDVAGFPTLGEYGLTLGDSEVRRVPEAPEVGKATPPRLSAAEVLKASVHGRLVKLRARLIGHTESPTEHLFLLEDGNQRFSAVLPKVSAGARVVSLPSESILELTGVPVIRAATPERPRSLLILIESPADLALIESNRWLTAKNALLFVAGVAVLVLSSLVWIWLLRQRVSESEKLFRGAFDQAATGMFVTAIDGTLTKANSAFCAIVGYSEAELLQHKFVDIIHPEDRAACQELARRMLAGEVEAPRAEKRYLHKSGSIVWAEISPSLVRDSLGRPLHFIIHVADVTQRRQIATQLQRAKDAAEAASRAKSQFLANMSHEIRTPMNGVLGMVEMALDSELTPEQRDYLGMAKTSADDLLGVIDDVLDFSKIEAGKLDLDPIPFKLGEHLAQTMKPLALRADQKGLELTCDIRPEVPEEVVADPTRLRQILINLVGNAIKFTERGEVGLEVGVESPGEEQLELHFAVRDTGIGIALEKQRIIFEAFAQADGSTTRTFGGTGLGLTISSRLVEMMGGQIGMESQLGEGSCFHFRVPVRVAKPAASPKAMERAELAGLRVLVVDDNLTNRRILGEMLARWGMKPVLAGSGGAALARLHESRRSGDSFTLLLTDSNMPEMDGFAFVEQIRQQVDLGKTTIMMLTSAGQRGDAARCRELGIAAYLVKPVSQSQLLETILRVLGTKAEAGEETRLAPRHSPEQQQRSLRVLLAEDNPVNQKLESRLMEKRGHHVVVVANGREALEALEKQTFDLVVMDVSMPEMDGFEAARAIRAKETGSGSHLPIIAMTAHAMKGDRERCLAAGMDGYVSKPVQAKELLQTVESFLPVAA